MHRYLFNLLPHESQPQAEVTKILLLIHEKEIGFEKSIHE